MIRRNHRGAGLLATAGAAMFMAGCATAGTGAAANSPAPSNLASVSVAGPTGAGSVSQVPDSLTAQLPTPPSPVPVDPSGSAVPDWPTIQAAVAAADAQLATAKSEGWWSGPVCSPDVALHRENAGQDPLSDEQLRAECATNLAEFAASRDDYAALQALDASARAAELARVGVLLGLPAGQEPTVGQVVVAHGCEQGWITDAADCAGIPAG